MWIHLYKFARPSTLYRSNWHRLEFQEKVWDFAVGKQHHHSLVGGQGLISGGWEPFSGCGKWFCETERGRRHHAGQNLFLITYNTRRMWLCMNRRRKTQRPWVVYWAYQFQQKFITCWVADSWFAKKLLHLGVNEQIAGSKTWWAPSMRQCHCNQLHRLGKSGLMSATLQKSLIVAITIAITIAVIEYFNILLSSDLLQTKSQRKIFKSFCCNITCCRRWRSKFSFY